MGKIASSLPSAPRPRPAPSLHPFITPSALGQRPQPLPHAPHCGSKEAGSWQHGEGHEPLWQVKRTAQQAEMCAKCRFSLAAHGEPGAPSQSREEQAGKGQAPHWDGIPGTGSLGQGGCKSRALSRAVTQASQRQGRTEPAPDVLPLFPAPHLPLETCAVNLFLAHLGRKEAVLPHPLLEANCKPSSGHSPLPFCLPAGLQLVGDPGTGQASSNNLVPSSAPNRRS